MVYIVSAAARPTALGSSSILPCVPALTYVLRQLQTLCTSHPVAPKILFVPSRQAGSTVVEALAQRGTAWVNLRPLVVTDLAEQLAGPVLAAEERKRLTPDQSHFLVDELLNNQIHETDSPLAILKPSRRNTETFRGTLDALRNARVTPGELRDRNRADLAGLLEAYEQKLNDEPKKYDKAALLQRAIALVGAETLPGAVFAVMDETPLSVLEAKLLRKLTDGRTLHRIGRPAYGLEAPAHVAAHLFADVPPLSPTDEGVHPAGAVRTSGLRPDDADRISLHTCYGIEAEVRGVLQDVLRRGLAFDEVEIAYTTATPYVPQLVSVTEELGLPVQFASGLPVTFTVPGQAVLGLLEWLATGQQLRPLIDLLRTGRISFNRVEDIPETIGPQQVAAVLDRLPSGSRVDVERLEDRARDLRARLLANPDPDVQRQIDATEAAVTFVQGLEAPGSSPQLKDLVTYALGFLQTWARKTPVSAGDTPNTALADLHADALNSLQERLEELGEIEENDERKGRPSVAARAGRVREMLMEHTLDASVPRPGALYVAPIDRAGHAGRKALYVVGMDEASFPPSPSEDPILLDDDRAELTPRLELMRDKPAAQTWHLVRLLGQAAGHVTLTAAVTTLADGAERYPSSLFMQLAQQLSTTDEPDDALGATWTLTRASETPLTDTQWFWTHRGAHAQAIAARTYPALRQGGEALRQRAGEVFTAFDGALGQATPELVPGADDTVFSSSGLETLTGCPYRFFLRYVLGVDAPREREEDPARWLDALDFGSLLHEILHEFMSDLGRQPSAQDEADLLALVNSRAEQWRKEYVAPPNEVAYEADLKRLREAARIFLREEASRENVEPVAFELSFGMGERAGANHPAPVEIALGNDRTIQLRGQIDRIDRTPDGYELWDYKSGSDSPYSAGDLLDGGRKLQWLLYAYALQQLIDRDPGLQDAPVARSGYFFVSEKTQGRRIAHHPLPPEALAHELQPLFEMLSAGGFPKIHKNGSAPCHFCEFQHVCADESTGVREAKARLESTAEAGAPFAAHALDWLDN